jgi:RNA polymerase sigma factor (sigma-70 family)
MAWQPQAEVPGGFTDEAMLVAALRGGRHDAFEALHEGFAAPIYNLALRIVDDREEAKDVAQEALIKAYRGLPTQGPDLNLTPWLYRVTVNAAFDHVRARERRPKAVRADERPQMAAPVDEFERSDLAQRVEQTLRALPKRQQVALLLRDVHGLSVGETADALGLTRGSADVLLSRARSRFRRVFSAGSEPAAGLCTQAEEALAAAVGGGADEGARRQALAHSAACPDCRKTVSAWAAGPLGLGLVLRQLEVPAQISAAVTASAAGATTFATAAGEGAGGAFAGGLLAKLGALAGAKVAAVAAVAAVAVGTAGVATYEVKHDAGHVGDGVVAAQSTSGGGGAGASAPDRVGARDTWMLGRTGVRLRTAARGGQALRSRDGHARTADAAGGGPRGSALTVVARSGKGSAASGAASMGANAGSGAGGNFTSGGSGGGAGTSSPGAGSGGSSPGGRSGGSGGGSGTGGSSGGSGTGGSSGGSGTGASGGGAGA